MRLYEHFGFKNLCFSSSVLRNNDFNLWLQSVHPWFRYRFSVVLFTFLNFLFLWTSSLFRQPILTWCNRSLCIWDETLSEIMWTNGGVVFVRPHPKMALFSPICLLDDFFIVNQPVLHSHCFVHGFLKPTHCKHYNIQFGFKKVCSVAYSSINNNFNKKYHWYILPEIVDLSVLQESDCSNILFLE